MNENNDDKLIFIWNADSGIINTVKDFWHKALRPSTYQCNLCQTTFGTFGAKKEWKSFINDLGIDSEFLHKDEFLEKYDVKDAKYPSAYILKNGNLILLISQKEMDSVETLEEMEELVSSKIK
ncbi:MAG: hypothetical protein KGD70_09695 [Candidatus Lokiarchaeota archaeon]|nr:hypothetical protein [Candidatus Lokiarchaeota archaeon]